ncbi:MAG: precorrin-2 dehydrogenase/sirohydrochlorin ferrochelatase family protein [Oscillospiraceae bacterium]|jgi:precorrin-2 dehydrogenase/sirohydrochlorin ferrochelatase
MFFPFMMDVGGKSVVVVGGGVVAFRKCALFLRFGADVTVIAPEICEELERLEGIRCIRQSFDTVQLADAFAVIAATDDRKVNRAVSAYCQAHRIPVNVVDDPALCSFIVPATVQRGDLTLAVSTAGKSPSLAAKIRRELEAWYGPEYEERLALLGELRKKVLASGMETSERRRLLMQAAALELEDLQKLL